MPNFAVADNAYRRMSGDAIRKVFEDEFKMYGKKNTKICQKYLTDTSIGRALPDPYKEKSLTVGRTNLRVAFNRHKEENRNSNGKTGHIRADTVHRGTWTG